MSHIRFSKHLAGFMGRCGGGVIVRVCVREGGCEEGLKLALRVKEREG